VMAKETFWMPSRRTRSSTRMTCPWVAILPPLIYTGRLVFRRKALATADSAAPSLGLASLRAAFANDGLYESLGRG